MRAFVIDQASLSMVDSTAVFMLLELRNNLAALSVQPVLAGRKGRIEAWLRTRGFAGLAGGSDGKPARRRLAVDGGEQVPGSYVTYALLGMRTPKPCETR